MHKALEIFFFRRLPSARFSLESFSFFAAEPRPLGAGTAKTMSHENLTLAHVTHEAVEQLGGIGTVLEGLIAAPAYQGRVNRSILIGPFEAQGEDQGLAALREVGTVLYASHCGIDTDNISAKLNPIAWAFNTPIVYGTRTYDLPGQGRQGQADVLLIDVRSIDIDRLNALKGQLWDAFGLNSADHENNWDYELWMRLANPAFYALNALLEQDDSRCVVFAHEFMGVPTALKAKAEGGDRFRAVFHAHECSTARSLIENHPGHDTRFYAALNHPEAQGRSIESLFGDQSHLGRHNLIRHTHQLDAVLAVGQDTAQEMQRLTDDMQKHANVHLAYNGLPKFAVTPARKEACREQLQDYAEALTGKRPDILITHVTRPVISKGLWRDAALLKALEPHLEAAGLTACYFLLTSASGARNEQAVRRMEEAYGWPRHHRKGWADLVGPEAGLYDMLESVNNEQQNTSAILINQFGFSAERVGNRVPEGMDIADFRIATDVELGMATYEPFGISPLEPLAAGAVCVISKICGCAGLVDAVTNHHPSPNVLIADYTRPPEGACLEQSLQIGQAERDAIEARAHEELATELMRRIPSDADGRAMLVERGQKLLNDMNWDSVFEQGIWPVLADLWKRQGQTATKPAPNHQPIKHG